MVLQDTPGSSCTASSVSADGRTRLHSGSLGTVMTEDGIWQGRVTDLGIELLGFVRTI
jgi:hypothetical protein